MELTDRAAAPDIDPRVRKALSHFLALFGGQRWLNAVLVRRSQFDRRRPDILANLQNRRHIPGRRDVVGHDAESKLERLIFGIPDSRGWRRGQGSNARSGEKGTASYAAHGANPEDKRGLAFMIAIGNSIARVLFPASRQR